MSAAASVAGVADPGPASARPATTNHMSDFAQFLISNFDRLAEAPGGIAKLRALILRLAVEGKLVEATAERIRLVPLGDLCESRSGNGKMIKGTLSDLPSEGLFPCFSASGQDVWHDTYEHEADAVIVSAVGARCGKTFVATGRWSAIANTHILFPKPGCSLAYLHLVTNNEELWIRGGSAQPFVKVASTRRERMVYFPPLAEQQRILAKVEELMSLCDALEAAQRERETVRTRLRISALHRFTSPANDPKSAKFVFGNISRLTVAPEDVDDIRQSVLQMAVEGKLSSQERGARGDVLIGDLRRKKQALIAGGKLAKEKAADPLDPGAFPFELPPSWTWSRIAWIATSLDYGTSEKSERTGSGVPVVSMGNIQGGAVNLQNLKCVPDSLEGLPNLYLESGDILFNRTNSAELVGKTGIFSGESRTFTFASYLIRLRLFEEFANPRFVILATNAPYFRPTQIIPELVQQCGQANVNGTKLANFLIPLPPLAEQRRIVAKVDELMAVLDALEAALVTARATAEKLLAATIARLTESPSNPRHDSEEDESRVPMAAEEPAAYG